MKWASPQGVTRCVAVLAIGSMSCRSADAPGPPRDSSPVQTDATVYHLQTTSAGYSAWATATYTNETSGPVYFVRCMDEDTLPIYYLGRTGPDSTAPAFIGVFWGCIGGVPTGVLNVGKTISVRVWLGSLDSPQAQPPITDAERSGTFRILLDFCTAYTSDSDTCTRLPREQRQSNAFDVRVP